MNQTEALARRFSQALADELGDKIMRMVVERNRAETDPNVYHSHDFCDANQVMIDVCESAGIDPLADEDVDGAWTLARMNDFYPEPWNR